MSNMSKGCHNCGWAKGSYCESPGNGCDWVNQMFRGGHNSWEDWKPKESIQKKQSDRTISEILRELADKIEERT